MAVEANAETVEEYKAVHSDARAGGGDLVWAADMRNFSIYLSRFPDGRLYLFGYYEYVGNDYATDMAGLHAQPRNREWLAMCDPMQIPFPGETGWMAMDVVYHND